MTTTLSIEQNYVKNVYEKIANEFDVTRTYIWPWIKEIMNNVPKNSIIYDIGCGNGRNMSFPDYNFTGIDNCEKFVNICKEKNMNAILSDMTNIDLPSNSADIVMCVASFHHLSTNNLRLKALYEMKRLIKNNGKIIISVWSINQPKKTRVVFDHYGDYYVDWKNKYKRYYYIFKIDEIKQLFIDANLNLIDHYYDCGNEIFILNNEK